MGNASKRTRRKQQQAAQPKRVERIVETILTGTISGLITAAILKLLDW